MTSFNSSFFIQNRVKIRQSTKSDLIVITANGMLQKTRDDDAHEFKQEGNFWYLTGLNEPDAILVIDQADEYLILPKRSERYLFFSGSADRDLIKKTSGIKQIYEEKLGWERLSKAVKNNKQLATIVPSREYDFNYDIYTNPASRRLLRKIKAKNKDIKIEDCRMSIARLREIKTPEEVAAIKEAINQTQNILTKISTDFNTYKNERDIEAELAYYRVKNGLDDAFSPIIANGRNACTLHYQQNNSDIDKSKITLIDMGYSYNNYCADITRCIIKRPTKRQLEVHAAVIEISDYAHGLVKPGILPRDYEISVAKFAGEKLKELGLIKTLDFGSIHEYYRHRTSHFLGIDVHDDGDYEKPFSEGAVITVEPGIYIEDESIGIRIEDDVLLTKNGNENLSKSLSRNLDSLRIEKR